MILSREEKPPSAREIRRMRRDLIAEPSANETVVELPPAVLADAPLMAVLNAVQSAKWTLHAAGAVVNSDVRLGGRSVFLRAGDLRRAAHYLLVFAAADVALLFDRQGVDAVRFFRDRASSLVAVREFQALLETEWARLKTPLLSVRNNLAHHTPFGFESHNHGMRSLEEIRCCDLARLVSLCECCLESIMDGVSPARLENMRLFMRDLGSDSHWLNWTLAHPTGFSVYPSFTGIIGNSLRWPSSRASLAFRNWAESRERKHARERVDWIAAPDAGSMLLATYAVNGSAALSQLYFGLLAKDVGCGRRSVIRGPFQRMMVRHRIIRVFYASVVRLFEKDRINLLVAAERNWAVLPKTARSLFATYLWPLWRAYQAEFQHFRNVGAYHFTRSVDEHDDAFVQFQQRVHHNSVQSLLYMSFAFLEHVNARDLGVPFVQPHPTYAPAKSFDPRHFAPVYGTILGRKFFETPDFQLILKNQPRDDSGVFPESA
jgi:hypothetical protein